MCFARTVLHNGYCTLFTPYIVVIITTDFFLVHISDPFHLLMLHSLSDERAVVKCDTKSTRDKTKIREKKTK